MTDKLYVNAQTLLVDSFKLGHQIWISGYRPNWIIVLWRGGTPIGMAVQEFLAWKGCKTNHIAIRTRSYTSQTQSTNIDVYGLNYIVKNANENDRILIVDDMFDSGRSIQKVLSELKTKMRLNYPKEIKLATMFYKPQNNKTDLTPDFYLHTTDRWVVFPHEVEDMSLQEIFNSKGAEIASLFDS